MEKKLKIKSVVIVGGGTAGWLSAAALGHALKNACVEITVIDSPDIPTVGVGEATIPSFVDFLGYLGISKSDFIKRTNATFKLGIFFRDWKKKGEAYWHQFGDVGFEVDEKPFYQHWLKSALNGNKHLYTDYSPAVAMAEAGRFYISSPKRNSEPQNCIFSGSTYALHFDAKNAAKYLKEHAMDLGVKHIQANVESVQLGLEGNITAIDLANAEVPFKADFFVDCTGQRSLLLGESLGVEFDDWGHYLPVDRAAVVQSETTGPINPYTEAIAEDFGWRWRIPLRNRIGNGLVYSSKHCGTDTAFETLYSQISEPLITDPCILKFRTGKRRFSWRRNCIAIGLSAGFLEPLESTSIYLAMRGILNFIQMLQKRISYDEKVIKFNELMDSEFVCIRDFIILHYCTTNRTDTKFWIDCQERAIPETLKHKIGEFRKTGKLVRNDQDLFSAGSWYSVLEGMGVRPETYDLTINNSSVQKVQRGFETFRDTLTREVANLPTHREYIDSICARKSSNHRAV